MTVVTTMPNSPPYMREGYFYPPHAKPLTGTENLAWVAWKFLKNPIEAMTLCL